jgi:hypothetical protein
VEGAGEITARFGTSAALIGFVTAGDDIDPVQASPEIAFNIYNCNGVAAWDKNLKNFEVCSITDNITNDSPGIIGAIVTRAGSTQTLPQVLVSAATTIGSISPSSGTAITNANGKAILDIYSNGAVGAGEISLKVQGVTSVKAFEIGRVDISLEVSTTVGTNTLPAGGSTIIEVIVKNPNGSLATGQPFTLNITSECAVATKAIIDTPVVTNAGKGYATYRSTGCEGLDTISVSANTGGSAVTKTTTVTVDTVSIGSIQYVSASPKQLALRGTGGISGVGNRSETSTVAFKLLDAVGQAATQKRVCFELSTEVGQITLTPAPIAQDFIDCPNMPNPGQAGYPTDISLPNKYAVAYTNSTGDVSVTVNAGDVPTAVKVFAIWDGSNSSGHNRVISNISDELVISTGLADNGSFSLAATVLNPEGWDHDNQKSVFTLLAADHFNNLVPAGTVINFRTEGGAIDASCTTGVITGTDKPNGGCSVEWRSQDDRPFKDTIVRCPVAFNGSLTPPCIGTTLAGYRDGINSIIAEPRPGRTTITAYAIGEESFVDLNGNGLFDTGEPFSDLTEAFTDHNEDGFYRRILSGAVTPGSVNEEPIDYNFNGVFDTGDNLYTGLLCAAGSEADCSDTGTDLTKAQLNIFRNLPIVMAGSVPQMKLVFIDSAGAMTSAQLSSSVIDLTVSAPQTVYLFVSDLNNNTLPVNTSITPSTDNGVLSTSTSGYTIGNNNANKPLLYPFTVGLESSPNNKASGSLTITVKTPLGEPVTVAITVLDAG